MHESVVLVNQEDQVIGEAEKLKAHQEGLLHRAFSIFVFRINEKKQLELLLQQRQSQKYHSANLWTNTCCSHPRPGEAMKTGAERRLMEEMGFQLPLQFLDKFYYQAPFSNGLMEHEWDYIFIGFFKEEKICFNPLEVQSYRWEVLDNIVKDVKNHPEVYTAWFEEALSVVLKNKTFIIQQHFKKNKH
jgi:isopentenyl-diphosphate Delta-isomerase